MTALEAINAAQASTNVLACYKLQAGGYKVVDAGYATPGAGSKPTKQQLDQQFRTAAQRVADNLCTAEPGYVRLPNGTLYEITCTCRTAKLVSKGGACADSISPTKSGPSLP